MWLRTTVALWMVLVLASCDEADVTQSREEVEDKPHPKKVGIVYLINVLRGTPRELSPPAGDDNGIPTNDFQKNPSNGLLIIRPLAIIMDVDGEKSGETIAPDSEIIDVSKIKQI